MAPELRWFEFSHLPTHLQEVSRPFYVLAAQLQVQCMACTERSVALRKLLEAKDAAVRALLFTKEGLTAATFGRAAL